MVSSRSRFARIFIFNRKYKVPNFATDEKRRNVSSHFQTPKTIDLIIKIDHMKNQHVMIVFLFLTFLSCTQNKSKTKSYKSDVAFDSVEVEKKFYLYKIDFKKPISKTENIANIVLPQFNRKSDSITLQKVLTKISLMHKLRFVDVAQNSAVFKIYFSAFKTKPTEEKILEEKFIGSFDLVTHKKVVRM